MICVMIIRDHECQLLQVSLISGSHHRIPGSVDRWNQKRHCQQHY